MEGALYERRSARNTCSRAHNLPTRRLGYNVSTGRPSYDLHYSQVQAAVGFELI